MLLKKLFGHLAFYILYCLCSEATCPYEIKFHMETSWVPGSENLLYGPNILVPYALDWENAKIVHFLA